MKLGLMFVNSGPFSQPETFDALVRTADEVGFESLWTVEHVVVPVGYESEYPYSPSGKMPGDETASIQDPLLPLAYAAAVTKQIRLATGILILPQRHPAYVAKAFATLDNLSRGRALAGFGIGWLQEEFDCLGIPFRERAARTEEAVQAIRSLWSDTAQPFDGKFYRWPAVESNPKPVQQPGVPIVIGGHVEGAARRAARIGDGFFPVQGDLKTLGPLLDALRDECGKTGRNPEEIEITTGAHALDLDTLRRYEDFGVSRLVMAPPAFDAEGLKAALPKLAETLIHKA
jgi:probable F420-dependent oxidoreductase